MKYKVSIIKCKKGYMVCVEKDGYQPIILTTEEALFISFKLRSASIDAKNLNEKESK